MESEIAVNNLIDSIPSTEIPHDTIESIQTIGEICPSTFQVGDKFSSLQEVQEIIKNLEATTGVKFCVKDSRRINKMPDYERHNINLALVYRRLRYICIKGGKFVVRKGQVSYERQVSTVRNECPAEIYFSISADKKFLEVRKVCDFHNHVVAETKAKRKVSEILAERGIEMPFKKQRKYLLEEISESQNNAGIKSEYNEDTNEHEEETSENTEGQADNPVEDLVREKKRSNSLKEQLLEEAIKRNNCLENIIKLNSLDEEILEESRTRNRYLEALLKLNCLRYNQNYEDLMIDMIDED